MSVAVGEWGHNCCIFCQNSKGMPTFGQHLEKNGGNCLNDILYTQTLVKLQNPPTIYLTYD